MKLLNTTVFLSIVFASTIGFAQYITPERRTEGRMAVEHSAACRNILTACKKAGFIMGGREGNGVFVNCFFPIIRKLPPTQKGQPVKVTISSSDRKACQVALQELSTKAK